jgi:N-acetylglucosamine-6-phosphate deacetylase
MTSYRFTGISLHTPGASLENGELLTSGGLIGYAGPLRDSTAANSSQTIDGGGAYLAPGFIDLQINGAFGSDFTTDPASIWEVGAQLPQYGVTAFLPTVVTSPAEKLRAARAVVSAGPPAGYRGARVLGLHVEGPFINPEKKGAHNPAHIRPPDPALYADFSPENGVRLVTLAPEMPGAGAVIEMLVRSGVVVSAGHSAATYEQAREAFDGGVRYATHLFNAMTEYHQHRPGLVGAVLDDERLMAGLINDGVHVHPAVVRMLLRVLGPERLTLVTDAIGALGRPPGDYMLGDFPVVVDETSVRLHDGTLAGSVLSADQAVRNLIAFTGCSLGEAVRTMTLNPARLLGLEAETGQLDAGLRADLVLLSEQLEVLLTVVDGEIVYVNEQFIRIPESAS